MTIMARDDHHHAPGSTDARTPVLALHAAASSAVQWQGLTDYLRGRHRVFAPDLPGYGTTRMLPVRQIRDIARQIANAKAGQAPLHVVGHSLGAAVALELAILCPGLVRSLTLIEPMVFDLLRDGDPSDRALFGTLLKQAEGMLASVARQDNDGGMRTYVDFWYGAGAWRRTSVGLRERLSRQTLQVASDLMAALAGPGDPTRYNCIRCPTLLLKGLQSPVASLRATEIVAFAIPRARLMMMGDAGHMAPLTDPHIVDPLVGRHLSSVDGRGQMQPVLYCAA